MKLFVLLITGLLTGTAAMTQEHIAVKISGSVFNTTSKEMILSQQLENNKFQDFATVKLDKEGKFELATKLPQSDYYVLRINEGVIHLILRQNSDIKVYGDGKKLKDFCNFVGSDESKAMNDFSHVAEKWSAKSDSAITSKHY